MSNVEDFMPYVRLIMIAVTGVLAIVLASSARNIVGKRWLVAFAIITLVTGLGFEITTTVAQHLRFTARQVGQWYGVLSGVAQFGTACFGIFLLGNWLVSRMAIDVKTLLFSFSGRIPRSAFWILICILGPLSTSVGFAVSGAGALGWVVFTGWCILSVWISLAVYTKRWHDCSKSGWMSLILLIPIIGVFWFLGYLGFVRGAHGVNQYGSDPLDTHGTAPNLAQAAQPC